MKTVFAAIIGLIGSTGLAAAQAPVAVVEDVQGPVNGVEFMDYVVPGKVIKLGAGGTVVLGYIKSCWRETITGIGTVIVGNEESMVHLGEAKTSKVACDSARTQLIDQETGQSAATVVRSVDGKSSPRMTLYGLSPMIETTGRGKLVVERLDVKGERYDVDLTPGSVARGKFYDFAKAGTALKPGGIYEASQGPRKTVFLVDRSAQSGATPIIGRLVRLQ
jgi:predicted extracellular nuclease